MISAETLSDLYVKDGLSMKQIADQLNCSINQVAYWMDKHNIERRTISDAIYLQQNPQGDPFTIRQINTLDDAYLFGMGIGIYWGEGNKRNKHSVRLGNTDPELINTFLRFLTHICGVKREKIRFGLQIFSDMEPREALHFWIQHTGFPESHFQSTITVTPSRSAGTYRNKTQHGVLTVHFNNYKLRDIIVSLCRDSSVGRAHPWWVADPAHERGNSSVNPE